MRLVCTSCESTGIGPGMKARFGELMNLCPRCDGHGVITDDPGERDFVAIFPVSARFLVHLTCPRRKGGFVEFSVAWSPDMPRKRGRKALTLSEQRAYEQGRTTALVTLMDQMGGGDFDVVVAEVH
jgi:hypothetical protein